MSAIDTMVIDRNKLSSFVSKVFLVKSPEWEYERELRQIAYFGDANRDFFVDENGIHLSRFDPKSVINVYLGCNISPDKKVKL